MTPGYDKTSQEDTPTARFYIYALFLIPVTVITALFVRDQTGASLSLGYIGGATGDGGIYVWLSRAFTERLITGTLFTTPLFELPFFYPYGTALAFSDNYIIPSLITALLSLALSHTVAYNTTLLLASISLSLASFFLFSVLHIRPAFAFLGALLISCLGYLSHHLGHPQLQWAYPLPLAAALALSLRVPKPHLWQNFALGITLSSSFFCSVYIALFSLIVTAIIIAVQPSHFLTKRGSLSILAILAGLLPLIAIMPHYLEVKEAFGSREIYESYYLAAKPQSYLAVSPNARFASTALPTYDEEFNLFPGWLVLILGAVAYGVSTLKNNCTIDRALFLALPVGVCLILSAATNIDLSIRAGSWLLVACSVALLVRQRRDPAILFLALSILFFILSFGPLGNPEKGTLPLGLYALVHAIVPGADGLRAIARAGLPATLFFICFIITILSRHATNKRTFTVIIIGLLFAITEQAIQHPSYGTLPASPPLLSTMIAPEKRIAIALPYAPELDKNKRITSWGRFAEATTTYMQWFVGTQRTLVNGYSGIQTKLMRELPRELAGFPDKRSVYALRGIAGLREIFYLTPPGGQPLSESTLKELGITIKQRENSGSYLLELSPEEQITGSRTYLVAPSTGAFTLTIRADSPGTLSITQDGMPLLQSPLAFDIKPTTQQVALFPKGSAVRPRRITISSNVQTPVTLALIPVVEE
jgi:hypothetical protein